MTKYLMNPVTGSVGTEESWLSEMSEWEVGGGHDHKSRDDQFRTLIEVVKDENGDWVEA